MKRILTLTIFLSGLGVLGTQAQDYRWVTGGNDKTLTLSPVRSTMDAAGNTIVTGTYARDIDMNFSTAAADTAMLYAQPIGNASDNVFFAKYDEQGNFKWAKNLYNRENSFPMSVTDVTTDAAGNIYIAGNYSGSCDFNPSPAPADTAIEHSTFDFGSYMSSMYIAKYDTGGNFVWVMSLNGSIPLLTDISIKGNKLYATGTVTSASFFSPANINTDLNPSDLPADTVFLHGADFIDNPFIASYDLNGNFKMARRIYDDASAFKGYAVEADQAGNIYLTGNLTGMHDLNPSRAAADTAYLSGTNGVFLAKYDTAGNYIWAKQVLENTSFTFFGYTQLLKVLPNEVYVSAFYRLNPDFHPSTAAGDTLYLNAGNGVSSFLSRFSTNGNFQNAYSLGNVTDATYIYALEADDSSNLYIAGEFTGKVDFDLQRGAPDTLFHQSAGALASPDLFFAKYKNDTLIWSRKVGNPDAQSLRGMGVNNKHLTIFGTYVGNVIFDPMPPANLSSQLPADGVYIASYLTAPLDTAKQLLTYAFISPAATGTILPTDTVTVTVPFGTNVTNLVASFTTSPKAIAFVGTTLQTSGTTANNFTNIVTYTIMAEDSSTRDYYVKVSVSPSTGIAETEEANGFRVWPNPANNMIYFEKPVDVAVYDINGKLLLSAARAKELYVGHLTPGTYILKDKQGRQQKISIQ